MGPDERSITVTLEPCGGLGRVADFEARVGLLDARPSGNCEFHVVERDVVDLVGEPYRCPERSARTRGKARQSHFEF